MELRPNLKDGCHGSANHALPACENPALSPVTTVHNVTTSKYVDCCLIATLACAIYHNSDFLTISSSDFGLSLGERISGEPGHTVVSRRGRLFADRVEPVSVPGPGVPQVRRKVLASVPAGGVADGGFTVEGVR